MNQLIQKWREFNEWWSVNGRKVPEGNYKGRLWRPNFDDFMDWLAEEELKVKK